MGYPGTIIQLSLNTDDLSIENNHGDFAMRGPPVISWFKSPSNYNYKYHKP